MTLFNATIHSIGREIFAGKVQALTLPGIQGEFQVLAEHAPLISKLKEGNVKILKEDGSMQTLPIAGGVIEVAPNETSVLVDF